MDSWRYLQDHPPQTSALPYSLQLQGSNSVDEPCLVRLALSVPIDDKKGEGRDADAEMFMTSVRLVPGTGEKRSKIPRLLLVRPA